ncbi:hypothetical protein niasHT_024826 [Heterodera trifolii]|uniref:CMP/dCMP-type deaminase domain-containing protein n=1 Tax=Heterodera trifolii TaxID=157864 RepID=A0ABD2KG42_9BILA
MVRQRRAHSAAERMVPYVCNYCSGGSFYEHNFRRHMVHSHTALSTPPPLHGGVSILNRPGLSYGICVSEHFLVRHRKCSSIGAKHLLGESCRAGEHSHFASALCLSSSRQRGLQLQRRLLLIFTRLPCSVCSETINALGFESYCSRIFCSF